jgi:hypothetical protein
MARTQEVEWELTSGGNLIATDYPHVIVIKILGAWYVFNRADQINLRPIPFETQAVKTAVNFIHNAYQDRR